VETRYHSPYRRFFTGIGYLVGSMALVLTAICAAAYFIVLAAGS
jgi:hypothetical protein